MPTKPKSVEENSIKNTATPDILNAIRDQATDPRYAQLVPKAVAGDIESIRAIGRTFTQYPFLQNSFLEELVNRLGMILIPTKMFYNPWSPFKKGFMEFGETIEELFVELAKPFQYNQDTAENEVFKRQKPDVRSAFHIMNYQKFYKATVSSAELKQAFLSMDGVTNLLESIMREFYDSAEYDEFLVMKYMLALNIINGKVYPVQIPTVVDTNMSSIVAKIKSISNEWVIKTTKYNYANVHTQSPKDDQYLITTTWFDALMDVEVLASAFNMDKVKFIGHRLMTNKFGELDKPRLELLFDGDPNYVDIPQATLDLLDEIPCFMCDKDYFVIFDNLLEMKDVENGQGLYWNYWLHVWKTFSTSIFAQNAVFVTGLPEVLSVSVSPQTATVTNGQTMQFSATADTEYFAPSKVFWSVDDESIGTISQSGLLTVKKGVAGSITVTATSVFDNTVTGTSVVAVN